MAAAAKGRAHKKWSIHRRVKLMERLSEAWFAKGFPYPASANRESGRNGKAL
jgi:hypothetical protein